MAVEKNAQHSIEISDAWFAKLNAAPFLSCKYKLRANILCRAQGQDSSSSEVEVEACTLAAQEEKDRDLLLSNKVCEQLRDGSGRRTKARGSYTRGGH